MDSNQFDQFNQFTSQIPTNNQTSNQQFNTTNQVFAQVPVKIGFWNSFKNFWLKPVTLELTPYQKKVFQEVHDFWNQEIVLGKGGIHLRKVESEIDDLGNGPIVRL